MINSANNTSSILIFDKISKLTYTLEKLRKSTFKYYFTYVLIKETVT